MSSYPNIDEARNGSYAENLEECSSCYYGRCRDHAQHVRNVAEHRAAKQFTVARWAYGEREAERFRALVAKLLPVVTAEAPLTPRG